MRPGPVLRRDVDGAPSDGTHGAVTIANATSSSFDWGMTAQALHDYDTDAVIVQIEGSAYVYFYTDDFDDWDTNLVSPGGADITSVSFCFDQKEGPDPTPAPTPTPIADADRDAGADAHAHADPHRHPDADGHAGLRPVRVPDHRPDRLRGARRLRLDHRQWLRRDERWRARDQPR